MQNDHRQRAAGVVDGYARRATINTLGKHTTSSPLTATLSVIVVN